MRRLLLLGCAMLLSLALGSGQPCSADAAAPRLIMFHGAPLSRSVIVGDWWDSARIIQGPERDPRADALAVRPFYEVALFWGDDWERALCSEEARRGLRPDQATQYARLYPAVSGSEPLFVYRSIPGPGSLARGVTAEGIAVVARLGLPVEVSPDPDWWATPMITPIQPPIAVSPNCGATLSAGPR